MNTERTSMSESQKKELGRRNFLKLAAGATGTGFALAGAGLIGWELYKSKRENEAGANFIEGSTSGFNNLEIQNLSESANQAGSLATPTPFQPIPPTGESTNPEQILTPTPTPEVRRMVESYILADTIDLADKEKPIVMAIKINSGKWIVTPQGSPIAYSEENNSIFANPESNTVETYIEEQGPTTWAHSGSYNGVSLFAADLQRLLRNPNGITVTLTDEEGNPYEQPLTGNNVTVEIAKAVLEQELIGAKVYLFQGNSENSFPEGFIESMNLAEDFDGNILELEIAAGVRIPRWERDENGNLTDLIDIYSSHVNDTQQWTAETFPDSGFTRNIDWRLKFCSLRYDFEPPEPETESKTYTNPATYARVFLGFVFPENGIRISKVPTRKFV